MIVRKVSNARPVFNFRAFTNAGENRYKIEGKRVTFRERERVCLRGLASRSTTTARTATRSRREFLRSALVAGAGAFVVLSGARQLLSTTSEAAVPKLSSLSADPSIRLTTLEDIVAGKVRSATKTGGHKFTKTTGLNGVMVEVQSVKVVSVSGPAHDTDFHIVISDGGKQTSFLTENIRFPLRTGPYLVSNPNKGDVVNMVGTAYHDGNHWEIHPVFAWQLASKGLVTGVARPRGRCLRRNRFAGAGLRSRWPVDVSDSKEAPQEDRPESIGVQARHGELVRPHRNEV
jgi:hypothetical protein